MPDPYSESPSMPGTYRVSQQTVNQILAMGMQRAYEMARTNPDPEFREAVARIYPNGPEGMTFIRPQFRPGNAPNPNQPAVGPGVTGNPDPNAPAISPPGGGMGGGMGGAGGPVAGNPNPNQPAIPSGMALPPLPNGQSISYPAIPAPPPIPQPGIPTPPIPPQLQALLGGGGGAANPNQPAIDPNAPDPNQAAIQPPSRPPMPSMNKGMPTFPTVGYLTSPGGTPGGQDILQMLLHGGLQTKNAVPGPRGLGPPTGPDPNQPAVPQQPNNGLREAILRLLSMQSGA